MPRLTELAAKKNPRARKPIEEDLKRKTPPAEDEASVPESAVPKSKGLTIKEPTVPVPKLPRPIQGKGKGKMEEPPRPLKRLKRASETLPALPTTVTETVPEVVPETIPETATRKIARPQFHAALDPRAGEVGFSMVNEYVKWLGQCTSSVASDVWERLLMDNSHSLLSFGMMSSYIVSKF